MVLFGEVPPTAGLPLKLQDWLPTRHDLVTEVAEMFGLPPLQLECSGTAALVLALETLKKIPKNKGRNEVIIPGFNCPLVVLAIAFCGLKPRLCDTIKDGFDFDFDQLETLLGDRTLCVVPTHIGGQMADVVAAATLAHRYGAYVIEDAAQALGSSAGASGDIVFFSLAVGKGLTLFEGGLITAKDKNMRQALTSTHKAMVRKNVLAETKKLIELFVLTIAYRPFLLSWFYGKPRRKHLMLGNLEQAVGDIFNSAIPIHTVSLMRAKRGARAVRRLPDFLQQTKYQAISRIEKIKKIPSLKVLQGMNELANTWPFISVLMPDVESCDRVLDKLWKEPIGVTRLFIHPLNGYDYLAPYLLMQTETPNAKDLADRMLTISNSLWLADEDFDIICHQLREAI